MKSQKKIVTGASERLFLQRLKSEHRLSSELQQLSIKNMQQDPCVMVNLLASMLVKSSKAKTKGILFMQNIMEMSNKQKRPGNSLQDEFSEEVILKKLFVKFDKVIFQFPVEGNTT